MLLNKLKLTIGNQIQGSEESLKAEEDKMEEKSITCEIQGDNSRTVQANKEYVSTAPSLDMTPGQASPLTLPNNFNS